MTPRAVWAEIDALWKRLKDFERRATIEGGGIFGAAHASTHSDGEDDELDVTDLGGFPGGSPLLYLDSNGEFTDPVSGGSGSPEPAEIEPHGITVDGGGDVLEVGIVGRFRIPFDYEIVRWSLLADQAGDIEFDVKVSSFGGSPASIVGGAPPTLSGVAEDDDSGLSGWTPTGSAGDEFEFEITGTPDAITRATLVLDFERV